MTANIKAVAGELDVPPELVPVSSSAGTAGPQLLDAETTAAEFGMHDGGDAAASPGHAAMTILYDDDMLALDGTIL